MPGRPQPNDESVRTVEVQLLGQRMVLKSDNDPQHVEDLAIYVKRKVDEIAAHGPVPSSKLALLAALNIADDYFRALDEARQFKRQVAQSSRRMLAELDAAHIDP
jgi:cell division protein ZapA